MATGSGLLHSSNKQPEDLVQPISYLAYQASPGGPPA
jgi:hypothetical protein